MYDGVSNLMKTVIVYHECQLSIMSLTLVTCVQGDSGTVSSDTSSDDEIVSVVSQPQKALSSDDTTHLTNGDTIHCDDASPLTSE